MIETPNSTFILTEYIYYISISSKTDMDSHILAMRKAVLWHLKPKKLLSNLLLFSVHHYFVFYDQQVDQKVLL